MYPMLRRRTFALVLAIALLVLPATSLAQSAGDDQYNDPLAGQTGGGHSGTSHSGGGHSGGSKGSTGTSGTSGTGSAATPTPAAATPSTSSAASANPQASAAARKQLPRTGFDVILTVEMGLALLLTGVTAQRTLVLRDRRR
jgi:hypothetical protein